MATISRNDDEMKIWNGHFLWEYKNENGIPVWPPWNYVRGTAYVVYVSFMSSYNVKIAG